MTNQQYADKYYKFFSKAEGNQHIASLFAIKKILDIVELNQPKNILEIGLGIGGICYSIVEFLDQKNISYQYYGTENNEFCLSQLPIHMGDKYKKLHILPDISKVDKNIKYDLVIIDGSDDALDQIKNIIATHGVIFIEGDRIVQVDTIRNLFPKHVFTQTISNYKDPEYGPFDSSAWSGGGKLIYVNPTPKQKNNYYFEKLKTSFRQRIVRKYFS